MRKFFLMLFLPVALILINYVSAHAENRALIITSDIFCSAPDIYPSAANNAKLMENMLVNASTPFLHIEVLSDSIASRDSFFSEIHKAFKDTDEDDTSYLYLSTHGVMEPVNALILSNGFQDYYLTPEDLRDSFSSVKGVKVIIIDACHSGSFIAKGSSTLMVSHAFTGDEFKIITSSGAEEESWYWQYDHQDSVSQSGGGYFTDILVTGLSVQGGWGADTNQDGKITLNECHQFLLAHYGASTPRIYPENDDFYLLEYSLVDLVNSDIIDNNTVTGISCERGILSQIEPTVYLEFTVLKPVIIAYRFVYYISNHWDFTDTELVYDTFDIPFTNSVILTEMSPGRKSRSLRLTAKEDSSYGYVMMYMMMLSNSTPVVLYNRLLTIPPLGGEPDLIIHTADSFCPIVGEEMPIHINHNKPLEWSVCIEDISGSIVSKLRIQEGTRPENLSLPGSVLYWDGKTKDGAPASIGLYRVHVTVFFPDDTYDSFSSFFWLL